MSRDSHYKTINFSCKDKRLSPYKRRRHSLESQRPSTSPHKQKSYKTKCIVDEYSDYSIGLHSHSRKKSYNSESEHQNFKEEYLYGYKNYNKDWDCQNSRSSEYKLYERNQRKSRSYDSYLKDKSPSQNPEGTQSNKCNKSINNDGEYSSNEEPKHILNINACSGLNLENKPPSKTISITNLAKHVHENDILKDITNCGLRPKDIRLIRDKDTGTSRGFAFVEFFTVEEAVHWMKIKQGVLVLQDYYRAVMRYSVSKDACQQSEKHNPSQVIDDWFCIVCGARNFNRRYICYKCYASRIDSEEGKSGSDEVCAHATETIMLRNLDTLTTEDAVITVLKSVIPYMVHLISEILISKDPLTSVSRGICYLAFENSYDSLLLYTALTSLETPLTVDGKIPNVSYCKYNINDIKNAVTQKYYLTVSEPKFHGDIDFNYLTDYNANRSAENSMACQYNKMQCTQQINDGVSTKLNSQNQIDSTNAAAALAQNAILQKNSKNTIHKENYTIASVQIPNGKDGKIYPIPDITKYYYDESTGYYYDITTGLYYDKKSQYFYNDIIKKYLYWDNEKRTYHLAPGSLKTIVAATTAGNDKSANSKKAKVVKDRIKVAEKISKDMERWAKNLNQQKEIKTSTKIQEQVQVESTSAGSIDIGFAVLKNNNYINAQEQDTLIGKEPETEFTTKTKAEVLIAAYAGSSEDSRDEKSDEISGLLDWKKLICLLCKRQFCTKKNLILHKNKSTIHKKNLELMLLNKSVQDGKIIKYRDRAEERRLKCRKSFESEQNQFKEIYLNMREPIISTSTSDPIETENVGNKLMQKKNWIEAQSLGIHNQDTSTIIQPNQNQNVARLDYKQACNVFSDKSHKDFAQKIIEDE